MILTVFITINTHFFTKVNTFIIKLIKVKPYLNLSYFYFINIYIQKIHIPFFHLDAQMDSYDKIMFKSINFVTFFKCVSIKTGKQSKINDFFVFFNWLFGELYAFLEESLIKEKVPDESE